jgi:hypothetical protein
MIGGNGMTWLYDRHKNEWHFEWKEPDPTDEEIAAQDERMRQLEENYKRCVQGIYPKATTLEGHIQQFGYDEIDVGHWASAPQVRLIWRLAERKRITYFDLLKKYGADGRLSKAKVQEILDGEKRGDNEKTPRTIPA